jgi:hypothetical protein
MKNKKSKLMIFSNLMLDDDQHMPKYKHMPGDYLPLVFKELRDKRTWGNLSERQIAELTQYVVCGRCSRACAGTCEQSSESASVLEQNRR